MPIITRGAHRTLTAAAALLAVLGPLAAPAAANPSADEVKKRLKSATHQLEVVVEQYNDLKLEVKRGRAEAERLRTGIAPLEAVAQARSAEVGTMAAAAYRTGRAANVIGLLHSGSPQALGNGLAMLEALGTQRGRAIEALEAANANVAAAQESLNALAAREKVQGAKLLSKKRHIEGEIARLDALRFDLGVTDLPPVLEDPPPLPPGAASAAVRFVYAQLGKPYVWGASGPEGYDCSGLTAAAWRAAGVDLPHNARAQYGAVAHVGRGQLRPGDLVFYYGNIQHVGMYVGAGRIIHAPQHGERIRFDRVDYQPVHGYGRPRR
ncbi:C40 family peptidase [Asanoa sp. WMMD1127]|uniref:C40 family peptidase n=1 Tax=Asanoa sp. WMMD1127 TaxID=3016107 RepID=UPI002415DF98|nr:C40 family peptidase [Asanoa sp. WMMD1127]MDG4821313.1 C40 family peptidase [Asanoa sp. WMMD1127]